MRVGQGNRPDSYEHIRHPTTPATDSTAADRVPLLLHRAASLEMDIHALPRDGLQQIWELRAGAPRPVL